MAPRLVIEKYWRLVLARYAERGNQPAKPTGSDTYFFIIPMRASVSTYAKARWNRITICLLAAFQTMEERKRKRERGRRTDYWSWQPRIKSRSRVYRNLFKYQCLFYVIYVYKKKRIRRKRTYNNSIRFFKSCLTNEKFYNK